MKKTDFSPVSTPSPSFPLLPRFPTSAFAISQRVSLMRGRETKFRETKRILSHFYVKLRDILFQWNLQDKSTLFSGWNKLVKFMKISNSFIVFIEESRTWCADLLSSGFKGFWFWGFQARLKAVCVSFSDTYECMTFGNMWVQLEMGESLEPVY